MKYSFLKLTHTEKGFRFSQESDDQDRVRSKIHIGAIGPDVFVYCPVGQEKKWKQKLVEYIEKEMAQRIDAANKTLEDLERFKQKEEV